MHQLAGYYGGTVVIVEVNNPPGKGSWTLVDGRLPDWHRRAAAKSPLGLIQACVLGASVDNTADNEREDGDKLPDLSSAMVK